MVFRLSDLLAIEYIAEIVADLIGHFIKEVIGKSTTVVAHGLTCAYVIANAYRHPRLFERLILVAPPGVMLQEPVLGPLNVAWKTALRLPIVGQFIYNLLTSRQAIRSYYDNQGYH